MFDPRNNHDPVVMLKRRLDRLPETMRRYLAAKQRLEDAETEMKRVNADILFYEAKMAARSTNKQGSDKDER